MMLATNIYQILHKYRKNPHNLNYDGSVLIKQIEHFVENKLPIVFIFPGCHGKIDNQHLTIDHMPDLSEYLGIKLVAQMCMEIEAIYSPGAQLYMVHEGHFYVDTVLIHSDQTMDEYIGEVRGMLKKYPFIHSLTLKDFFQKTHSTLECRKIFFEKYAPDLSAVDELISTSPLHKKLYIKYLDRITSDFYDHYLSEENKFSHYAHYSKFNAMKQLQIWIGFRNLLKKHFAGVNHIRLSSVYKDPNVHDQVAVNYIPTHHLEMPSFNCVIKFADGAYGFIKKKEAVERKLILSDFQGYKFYKAV